MNTKIIIYCFLYIKGTASSAAIDWSPLKRTIHFTAFIASTIVKTKWDQFDIMRPSILALALSVPAATAFSTQKIPSKHATRLLAEPESKAAAAARPIDKGSHDELMYALGINLARQLGDVRPLVETPDEMTQVARGLLDAVVGKVDELSQREILQRRGTELNDVIVERA